MESLEDNDISTVEDLDMLAADEGSWKEVTGSWSVGIKNRIMKKLSELKAAASKTGAAGNLAFPFAHKECWIFYEPEYDKLRSVEGKNEKLGDLPATVDDAANA